MNMNRKAIIVISAAAAAVMLISLLVITDPFYSKEEKQDKALSSQYEASAHPFRILGHKVTSAAGGKKRRFSRTDDINWTNGRSGKSCVVMLTGDLCCQTRQQQAAYKSGRYDFTRSFDNVSNVFRESDLAIGNFEATVCRTAPYMSEQIRTNGKPQLNAPPEFLGGLSHAGFDFLVCANNHNTDTGAYGIFETIRRIEEHNFAHTGLFKDRNTPRYQIMNVNGIRIAVLSFASYYNQLQLLTPDGSEILLNKYNKETASEDIEKAKRDGAEFVITYIHSGVEYTHEPSRKQMRITQQLADAGSDYIVCSHSHVLQPYTILKAADGRSVPCWYSLGNFISHQYFKGTKDTVIVKLTLKRLGGKVAIDGESYIPCFNFTKLDGVDYNVLPLIRPYRKKINADRAASLYSRIEDVIGEKIKPAA